MSKTRKSKRRHVASGNRTTVDPKAPGSFDPSGRPSSQTAIAFQTQLVQHSGVLPPAEQLAAYDRVMPGLAERIVTMAEREQSQSHAQARQAMKFTESLHKRGQWFGLFAILAACATAAAFAFAGAPKWGAVIVLASLGSLAGAFILDRRHNPDSANKQ